MKKIIVQIGQVSGEPEPEPESVAEPVVKGVHPWARWEATDKEGEVYEYERKPRISHFFPWWIDDTGGRTLFIKKGTGPVHNWKETLRRVNA